MFPGHTWITVSEPTHWWLFPSVHNNPFQTNTHTNSTFPSLHIEHVQASGKMHTTCTETYRCIHDQWHPVLHTMTIYTDRRKTIQYICSYIHAYVGQYEHEHERGGQGPRPPGQGQGQEQCQERQGPHGHIWPTWLLESKQQICCEEWKQGRGVWGCGWNQERARKRNGADWSKNREDRGADERIGVGVQEIMIRHCKVWFITGLVGGINSNFESCVEMARD